MGQRRSRAVDQQLAKISVASLADAKKLRSAAGGELTWDQTQPRCQVATVLESLALADRRDQRRSDCRADARDGRQSTSVLILFRPANELGVKGGDPSPAHWARASATRVIIRELNPAPRCSSIRTVRNCSSLRLPWGATIPRSKRIART